MNTFLRALSSTFVVCTLVFLCLRLIPGDPVDLLIGESATPVRKVEVRKTLNLDQPLFHQYTVFIGNLLHADLGESLTKNKRVTALILERIPATLLLAFSAVVLGFILAVPAGLYSALYPQSTSRKFLFLLSIVLFALPTFWMAPLLILALGLHWPWLPVSGFDSIVALSLPTLTLALGLSASLYRITESSAEIILKKDYVRLARAKGLDEYRVLLRHVLPNLAVPLTTHTLLKLGHLMAGAIITETIFDWPGLGTLVHDAILQRDYTTVQGSVLVLTVITVALNTISRTLNEQGADLC